jgi:hypothetical protein
VQTSRFSELYRRTRDGIGSLGNAIRSEVRQIRAVHWSRLTVLYDLRAGVLIYFIVLIGAVVVVVLSLPLALASADQSSLIGRIVFAQLLVELLWMICTWFVMATIVPVLAAILSGRPPLRSLTEIVRSIPNLATWTGRIAMPVVLVSLAAGVAGFPTNGSMGRSLIASIGGIQLGMLFVALLIVLTFEAVRIPLKTLDALPWSLRSTVSVFLPFATWAGMRRLWPQYPMTISLLNTLLPSDILKDARFHPEAYVFYVAPQVGLLVFLLTASLLLTQYFVARRRARIAA